MPITVIMQVDDGARWLRLDAPFRVLEARRSSDVSDLLSSVEAQTRGGGVHAAGFVAYEAGGAFGLDVRDAEDGLPLAWFALFDASHAADIEPPEPTGAFEVGELRPSMDRRAFESAFARIRERLADGDTYQVNLTLRLEGAFRGDPQSLFAELARAQRGRYAALVRMGRFSICSASPELFFSRSGPSITARPMKGTAPRGRTLAEDAARADALRTSLKERAENVMVVDMMRSDLGRIAERGSVEVPELFVTERYPTLWQMTSRIVARSEAGLADIFAAAFPAASITGAPKVRTMQLIKELETCPRGVYTGAIGYVAPGGAAQFNVAIRTAVVDHDAGRLTFGIGSGVVWDSDPAREYEECLLKADVLRHRVQPFELLETLRWTRDGGYFLLQRHLDRLEATARYFGIPLELDHARTALDAVASGAGRTLAALRVRLLIDQHGRAATESSPLSAGAAPVSVALAESPIDPRDPFLFHKTTNRAAYERAQGRASGEVIFWNPLEQATESSIANVVIERGGRKITPPVDCGLLAGTFRAELLARGEIEEGIVTVDELLGAHAFWLINSVREWRPAVLRT
jgi:para-aminobenzoate synthetase / 4-amino-4-deoxychorismate lyase